MPFLFSSDSTTKPRVLLVRSRGQKSSRERGASMLVVMLVLLSVTGLAVFSMHATSQELRAAGHLRQSMQSQFMAQGGIDAAFGMLDNPSFGAAGLEHAVQTTRTNATFGLPPMEPFEPDLAGGSMAYRFFSKDFNALGGFDPAPLGALGPSGGTKQPYTPAFEVDITDYHTPVLPIVGEASGPKGLEFRYATFTSRARLTLTGGDFGGAAAMDTGRTFHESTHAARAFAVFGPL